jgi:hypothetical protein
MLQKSNSTRRPRRSFADRFVKNGRELTKRFVLVALILVTGVLISDALEQTFKLLYPSEPWVAVGVQWALAAGLLLVTIIAITCGDIFCDDENSSGCCGGTLPDDEEDDDDATNEAEVESKEADARSSTSGRHRLNHIINIHDRW